MSGQSMSGQTERRPRMSTRTFAILAVLVTLLIAGVGSYYASGSPDGLEYVAKDKGFDDTAQTPKTDDGLFSGYDTKGIDNDRLGGGLAGVAGVLLVLALAGGLTYVVRRRTKHETEASDPH